MRRCMLATGILAGALALSGCVLNETLLVVLENPLTEQAVSEGVRAGVDYGDRDLELGLTDETKADLSEKVAEKVLAELKQAAQGRASTVSSGPDRETLQ